MQFLKDKKAQGALEYLLIIGGAIVLAAIVIAIVLKITNTTKDTTNTQTDKYTSVLDNAKPDIN